MKYLLTLLLLTVFALITNAQKTEIQYLSGTDKDNTVTWDFFCTNGMNSGKWSTIQVPSQWEQQGFGSYLYGNIDMKANEKGLYKFEFSVPKTWDKKVVYIVFEGSMTDTEVKINGKLAGPIHQGAFYRFKYDITKLLNFKGKNLLEIMVSKESANESVNRAERLADYWVFGGIFRPVYLKAQPEQFIDRVAIDAKADGSFYMDVFLQGASKAKTIEAQVFTMDGKPFGKPLTAIINETAEKVNLKGSYSNPALWNPEFPNRYQVVVSLKNEKKIKHQFVQKFGFRTVEVKPADGIYVNGTKIMFRGVCRHTFWPTSGRTSSKQLAIDDVNLIKDMNMNAVRMSHYPPDQYFLDVCDSMGLFVLDELAGWQKYYDTPTAKRLVKQTVERDVNHPSIVLWDNGNEGGFNKDVRLDYALYDPQNRLVIEPWSKINGTDTKHYPKYQYVYNALNNGNLIYFPTEFLHGLFDGGHGAGLDDYWNLMLSKPLSAGGFLWVFADEGIVRKDWNDSIDNHGNNAPDGILGPYHEKEGSFYTIKEIWSPVHIKKTKITEQFDGKIQVNNRFLYTNLNQCKFTCELVKFQGNFPMVEEQKQTAAILSPSITPGDSGTLQIDLPVDWKNYDVLYVSATDPYGRQIYTWSWNITLPQVHTSRIVKTTKEKVSGVDEGDFLILSSGKITARFSKKNGLLSEALSSGQVIPFNNGPVFLGDSVEFKSLKHYQSENNYVIEVSYNKSPDCYVKWTMLPGGWLELQYQYHPQGKNDYTGITFDFPEELVTGATLMANGPYRVWKNRLKGVEFGVYNKKYNNTITGQTWDYPEFKGYYSNFYAVQVQTKQLPFTIVSATDDLFLHLFTPAPAKFMKGDVNPPFPSGNISILNGISAIGTKFSQAEEEGPQGQMNEPCISPFTGRVYFLFGE
jgi:hypothetical protein